MKRKSMRTGVPLLRTAGASVLACLLALSMVGCRWSNELVEVRHDQDAETVDYETEEKNYVAVEDADALRDSSVATYLEQSVDGAEIVEETVPVFDTVATVETAVERVFYDADSPLDRTAPLFTLMQDIPPEEDTEDDPEEEEDPQQDDSSTDVDESLSGSPEEEGTGGVSDNGEDDGDGEGSGDGDGSDGDGDGGVVENPESAHSPSDRGTRVFNESGSLLEPLEDVHKVATVGEYANMVLMVGGTGVLCAADDDFLDNDAVQRIFGDESWDLSNIESAWTYDESSGTYAVDFDALVASEPDLVLVPEGMTLLSDEQQETLLANGTSVEAVPAFDSVDDISSAVWWLGETLGVTDAGTDASARASEYRTTYLTDDINALITQNGGLTSYNNVDYSSSGQPVGNNSNWTVFVTDWDFDAVYNATYDGVSLWSAQGLALAKSGYGWSPVNYYFSVGGVNNNAAQFPDATSAQTSSKVYPVWQFNLGTLRPDTSNFSSLTKSFTSLKSSGDASCLVRAPASFSDVSDESDVVTVLGDEDFRYVLCATQEIADAMTTARDRDTASQTGLYAAYEWRTGGLISGVGYVTPTDRLIEGWIGNLPSWSVDNRSSVSVLYDEPYGVQTVANGLYCDWINGSVESFLMAFWIDDFYSSDGADYSSFMAEATEFYQYFYNYELTSDDIQTMLAGRAS